jgi:hypothetical protein
VGTVWLRRGTAAWPTDTGGWTAYPSPGGVTWALNDVVALRPDDVWGVGEAGTIVRYSVVVTRDTGPPPCTTNCTPPPTDTTPKDPPPSPAPDPGPPPQVTVVQRSAPRPTQPTAKKGPTATQSVLRGVRVKVLRGRLLISFRLVAPARVSARAMRAGKLVGRSSARLLKAGRGSLVVPYRGAKPPSQLQIIVRPVSGAGPAGGQ